MLPLARTTIVLWRPTIALLAYRSSFDTDGTGIAPAGLVETETDPLGRVTHYTYDAHGLVTSIVAAEGTADETTTSYEYDASDRRTAMIDPLGRRTEYAYDALDRMTQMTSFGLQSPASSLFAYDARGNQRFVTDPLGNVTEYVYNERNWVEQKIEAEPDGAGPLASPVTTYDYDCVGNLVSTTDPLGRVTTSSYDALNRLSSTTLPDPDGAGPLASPVRSQTYDALGNLLTSTDALGNVTSYRYDALSRLVEMTEADPDGAGPLSSPVTSYAYDLAGQLTSTTDPLGRTTSYEYDDLGRLVKSTQPDPDGAGPGLAPWTVFAYDKAGNLLSETDRLGNATTYGYDNLNRRTSETDANGDTTQFAFDDAGNLVSLTDPEGNETTWTYDALNRVIEETNELNATRYFEYDAIGNLIQKIDRDGRYTQYEYDNLYRRTEERWLDPTDDTTVIHTLNWAYDVASQLTEAADSFADYDYTYDNLGRATSIAATLAGLTPTVTLAQQFDANSRRTQLAATIGSTNDFQNSYAYDNLHRLVEVEQSHQPGSTANVAAKDVLFSYDAASQLTGIGRYSDLAATSLIAQTAFAFDQMGRLTGLAHTKSGGTSIAGYGWTYDAANRKTTFDFTDSAHDDEDVTYGYDSTSQLTGADRSGTANDESYAYDDNGNRTSGGFTVGTDNRYSNVTIDGVTFNLTYDAEGNLTRKTNASTGDYTDYLYDHRNRLYQVDDKDSGGTLLEQSIYTYDAFDRRVVKAYDADGTGSGVATETKWIYDGQNPVLEFTNYDPAGTASDILDGLTHRYLYGSAVDQVLADERFTPAAGSTNWLPGTPGTVLTPLADDQNTTRDLVNTSGAVQNHIEYNSFGRVTAESAATVDYLFGWHGFVRDEEHKLDLSDTRLYSSELNRWMNQDPIGFLGDLSNVYRYVANNPVVYVDPSGLWKFVPDMGRLQVSLQSIKGGFQADFYLMFLPDHDKFKKSCYSEVSFVQIAKVDVNGGTLGGSTGFDPFGLTDIPFGEWFLDGEAKPFYWKEGAADPRTNTGTPNMIDRPGPTLGFWKLQNFSAQFETAVVASKSTAKDGAGVGDVFGIVEWGFSYTVAGPIWNRHTVARKFYVNNVVFSDAESTFVTVIDPFDGPKKVPIGGSNLGYKSIVNSTAPSDEMKNVLSKYFP